MKFSFFLVIALILFNAVSAQTNHINVLQGTVLDNETAEPIPFTSVFIIGKIGTYTDSNGHYQLQIHDSIFNKRKVSVIYHYPGYDKVTQKIRRKQKPLKRDVYLIPSRIKLYW